jgi:hypothetical protein
LFSQQMLEAWFHWFPSMRSRCKLTCQPLIIYIYYVYVSILRSRYTIICNYIYNIYIYIMYQPKWLTVWDGLQPASRLLGRRATAQVNDAWSSEDQRVGLPSGGGKPYPLVI